LRVEQAGEQAGEEKTGPLIRGRRVKVLVKVFENWGKISKEFFRLNLGRRWGLKFWLKNLGTIFSRDFFVTLGEIRGRFC
jgi:hypothetical protein